MAAMTGPFQALALLLVLAGAAKLAKPAPAATALRTAGLGAVARLVRPIAAAEVVIGAAATAFGGRLTALALTAAYLGTTATAYRILRHGRGAPCGCFGATSTSPTTALHVQINVLGAAIASAGIVAPPSSFTTVMSEQALAGVPFYLLVGLGTALAYACLTILPAALDAADAIAPAGEAP